MEIEPGMFVSRADTTAWVPDPDVPGSEMVELVHDGPIWAGATRVVDAPRPTTWTPEHREVLVVLEGGVRIAFEDGTDVTLGVGDMATIPAGMTTTWHITTPFREMWVLVDDTR
ncbi:MAG: cupin domain-containing protein [Actinomycetota bacterium]